MITIQFEMYNSDNYDVSSKTMQEERPVTQKRTEYHQAVFEMGNDLSSFSSPQQQLASSLELSERQVLSTPLRNHLLQLSFNVFLLVCRYTNILIQTNISHHQGKEIRRQIYGNKN